MNWEQIQGKWTQFKGKIQEKWSRITDNDLDDISGKMEVLRGKLQEKYGYTREKAEQELENFRKELY